MRVSISPFAGRVGGNQEFIVDRADPANQALIQQIPDAAPGIPLRELLDLRGFRVGTLILVYVTAWASLSPNTPPEPPTSPASVFATAAFLGPLVGGILNAIVIPLLIYGFGSISGGHLNSFITIATFARLTTSPRRALRRLPAARRRAGRLLLRASYDSRDFKDLGPSVGSVMATEFTSCLALIFLCFGVGLDPRQRDVFGPALAPALVGLAIGSVSLGMSFARPGYGGPGLNPTRCFGVYVGSRFPSWHWVHGSGGGGSAAHGFFYFVAPPWSSGISAQESMEGADEKQDM
ncbi:hypothetical protein K438DRAFT_1905829 [Mycena galopus ATCC 62051]|nr:hypothetical protein K438DRAFT_1905829 [Mycena galopus ATCC 62051]